METRNARATHPAPSDFWTHLLVSKHRSSGASPNGDEEEVIIVQEGSMNHPTQIKFFRSFAAEIQPMQPCQEGFQADTESLNTYYEARYDDEGRVHETTTAMGSSASYET